MKRNTHRRIIEALESRRMLSSAVLLSDGQLRITGDNRVNDVVTVGLDATGNWLDVVINGGAVRSFDSTKVQTVAFYGRSGADLFSVAETHGPLGRKVRFFGGAGDDIFKGGAENAVVRGEGGNDTLILGNGKNYANGGEGNDLIVGGANRDAIWGSFGNDTIDAGAGKNRVWAGEGEDTLIQSGATETTTLARSPVPEPTPNDPELLNKVYIAFNGTLEPAVINPFEKLGVTATVVGGNVNVIAASGINNIEYILTGKSAVGGLNMSSTTPATFVLNGVNITNNGGAAINITGGQTHTFFSSARSQNSLTDGTASTLTGALQSDGKIIFSGTGKLSVTGVKRHGILTTKAIEVQSSAITVTSAANDGLHSEGFIMSGGSVTVAGSTSDGVDAGDAPVSVSGGTLNVTSNSVDVKALKTGNNTITITGGSINLNVSGNASKAMSAKGIITISAGTIGLNLSGAPVLSASGSGFDPSYCSGIKSDVAININGGTLNIQTTAAAAGAKGISSDTDVNITNGQINITTAGGGANYINPLGVADSYSTTGITADGNINVSGGTLTMVNSGADGKAFSADNNISVTGGTIGVTNSGASGKGLKADGNITIAGGTTTVNLSGATVLVPTGLGVDPSFPGGLRALGSITVNSGSVSVTGTAAATGARGLSADGAINVNGGTIAVSVAGNGANYTNASGVADSYSAAAFSSDTSITITGGAITTASSGTGGKGLKSDGTITINNATSAPTVNLTTTGARFLTTGTDYNHPKTMVSNGAINISAGSVTCNSTDDGIHSDTSVTISGGTINVNAVSPTAGVGEGVEAPLVTLSGGLININASNDGINTTYGLVAGGQNSDDNSQLFITGGIIIVSGRDAIDANGDMTITGGITIASGPTNAPEEAIDYNGQFYMNGGYLMAAGSNSTMTRGMDAASTQVSMFLRSTTQLAATSLLHIRSAAGAEMVTFKPKNNVYWYHFSSGSLAQSTQYQVYFGGSYTGGSFVGNSLGWGVYTGGTYSLVGAVLRTSFTTSGATKINTITFT